MDNNLEDIEKIKNILEIKVRERTEELYQSKKLLETEIADRKLIDKRLKESETRYRYIIEHSTNFFYTHNIDHVLTYVSPQSFSFLGCSPEDAKRKWTDFVTDHPMNKDGFMHTQKAIDTGIAQPPFELELKTIQGKIIYVEVHETPIVENGKTVAIVGALINITPRKEAIKKNKDNEQKYRNLFENAPDGIIQLDDKGYILECNNAYCEMIDYKHEELIGKHVTSTLASEQKNLFKENFPTLINTGKLLLEEVHLTKKKGEIVKVRRNANAIYDANGKFSGIIVHTHNITKQKELEEKLMNVKKLEAVGLMASRIAHEFKNILQSIMGYSNFAIEGLNKDEQRYKDIDQIQKASNRADILVKNLLKTGKRFDLDLLTVNVHTIVSRFVNDNKNTFGERIIVEYNPGENLDKMLVNGDNLHIELVLLNMCFNAADAIEDKGIIKITTEITRNKKIQNDIYEWIDDKNFVTITVSDNGSGIDKNSLNHIFDPFFTTKSVDKGTGLGLSSAFEIIKTHKGFIEVNSKLGKGTDFFINIPLME